MSSRLKEVFSKNWKKIRNVGVAAGLAGASMMGARGVEASSQDIDQAARDAYRAGMPVETVTAPMDDTPMKGSLESYGLALADNGGGGGARSQEQQGDQQSNPEQQTTPEQEVDLPEIGPVTPAFLRTVDVVEIIPGTNLRSTPSLDGVALRGSGNLPGETFRFVGWTSPDTEGFRWMQLELGQVVDGVFTPVETEGYDTTVYAREDRAFPGSRQSVELRITLSEEELLDLQRSAAAFDPNIENVTMFQDQVMGTRMSASGAYLVLAIYDEQNGAWVDGPAAGMTPEPAQVPTSPSSETNTGTPSAPEQQPPLVPSPEAAQEAPLPTVQPEASQTPPEETVEEVEQEEQEPQSGIQATIPPERIVVGTPTPNQEVIDLWNSNSWYRIDQFASDLQRIENNILLPRLESLGQIDFSTQSSFTYEGQSIPFGALNAQQIEQLGIRGLTIPNGESLGLTTLQLIVRDVHSETVQMGGQSFRYYFFTLEGPNMVFFLGRGVPNSRPESNRVPNVFAASGGDLSNIRAANVNVLEFIDQMNSSIGRPVIVQMWESISGDNPDSRASQIQRRAAIEGLQQAITTGEVTSGTGIGASQWVFMSP